MPQQWCCPAWLVSSSPCTPSGPMSPPRPVTLAGTRPHVPGPDHTCPGSGVPAAAVLPGPEPGQGPPGTGAQLASYAGLAPVTRRSGSSIRSEVHLPRRQQEAQARHIPVRLHLPALRPPGRTGPRHRGPAPLRAARRPHHRPAVWSESSFTYRRPGIHRAGHDHPEEKTRETAPSPPTTRHITEPSTRSDTRSKGSSRTPKDLEDPAYRPQRIIGNFPDNRYSSPRDHIHLNPMNKTPY